jgi:hypothetical protein
MRENQEQWTQEGAKKNRRRRWPRGQGGNLDKGGGDGKFVILELRRKMERLVRQGQEGGGAIPSRLA